MLAVQRSPGLPCLILESRTVLFELQADYDWHHESYISAGRLIVEGDGLAVGERARLRLVVEETGLAAWISTVVVEANEQHLVLAIAESLHPDSPQPASPSFL
jgi:hypothetical protein